MTEHQQYIAEEIAEDHSAGRLTRREAMRRLGLVGLSVSAASALLARFAGTAAAKPQSPTHHGQSHGPSAVEWAPVPTEEISFPGPLGTLLASWAPAAEPRGGVLVIHENRGLNDHIRSVAGRLAAGGYSKRAAPVPSRTRPRSPPRWPPFRPNASTPT